jgi:hypothetical protein
VVSDLGPNTSAQAITPGSGGDRIVGSMAALSGNDTAAIWNRLDITDNQASDPFSLAFGVNNTSDIVGVLNNKAFAAIAQ